MYNYDVGTEALPSPILTLFTAAAAATTAAVVTTLCCIAESDRFDVTASWAAVTHW